MIWSNVCVICGPWIQWLFMANIALVGGHYGTNIISSVGHPRSDSAMLLMLCTVMYNIQGTVLYYRCLGIAPTLLKMDNILGRLYMIVMTYRALFILR
jgi:hypothetical protein